MRVLTTGTFDIPHAGHFSFLRKAAALGDELYVGVLSDKFVELYKGERPLYNQEERALLIQQATDAEVFVVSNQRHFFIKHAGYESVIAVGSDWARRDYYRQIEMTQDELDVLGATLAYVPYTVGISVTDIKERTNA